VRRLLRAGWRARIVAPVNASESIVLTVGERLRLAEVLVEQAAGRVPVVVGVSGVSTAASVVYARHARDVGSDAVMAQARYVRHPPADEIFDFYSRRTRGPLASSQMRAFGISGL
jgi:4-hydroxy-tetrahydrodipicolinate synthase